MWLVKNCTFLVRVDIMYSLLAILVYDKIESNDFKYFKNKKCSMDVA